MRTDPFRICSTSFRVGLPRTACSFLCNFSSFEVMVSFLWHFKQQLLLTMYSAERPLNALFHACAEVLHSSNNRVLKRQLTIWQLAIWCPAIPSLMLSFGRAFPRFVENPNEFACLTTGVTRSRATSGDRKNDPNMSGQQWNSFYTSYRDI